MSCLLQLQDGAARTEIGEVLFSRLGFEVHQGQLLLIRGENGSGKTTLLRSLLGLHKKFEGQLVCDLDRDQIEYLPQVGNLRFFLPLTLADVLGLTDDSKSRRDQVLALGLLDESALDRFWNTASGGERQKTLLTKAFLSQPQLLILDEPFNHLDSRAKQLCLRELKSLLKSDQAPGIILVSHDEELGDLQVHQKIELSDSLK